MDLNLKCQMGICEVMQLTMIPAFLGTRHLQADEDVMQVLMALNTRNGGGSADGARRASNAMTGSSLHVFVVVFCQNLGGGLGIVEEVVDLLDVVFSDGCPTIYLGE